MPNFETFSRKMLPLKNEPQMTIQRRGVISLNQSAQLALGMPLAVELLFDRSQRMVGLRAIDHRERHAQLVRFNAANPNGPAMISAMAFLNFYEIDRAETRRWDAYLDDDILCINLNQAATPVTSNRARKPTTLRTVSSDEGRGDNEARESVG